MKKRVLSIVLALCLVFSLLPASALAAYEVDSGYCGDYLTWTLDSDGTLTISGEGEMDDYGWYSAPWSENTESITKIVIIDGATSIGEEAFRGCGSLTSVTIPDSITSIGSGAFYNCSSLESVTIPDSVTSIGESAFSDCSSLRSITIPNSVASIQNWTFSGCSSLTGVTIGNGVTSIGDDAFEDCSSLTTIEVGKNNVAYCSDNGVLFNKDKTKLITYPVAREAGEYKIPDGVTSIGDYAFYDCTNLTSVTIGNGVKNIGSGAFYNCSSLRSVTIPNSVTNLGESAFSDCSSLTGVTIGNGVKNIGSGAFYNCSSLESVTIPDSITSIGSGAFYNCSSLESVTIPDSVTSIGESAFSDCSSLRSITIPNSVASIQNWTFSGCSSLTGVTIGNGVTSIGRYAFEDCSSLTAIKVGKNNKAYCSVSGVLFNKDKTRLIQYPIAKADTSYSVPNTVKTIDTNAFYSCTNLKKVTIPSSVTSIGEWAFSECSSLKSISIPSGVTSIQYGSFRNCSSLASVSVPTSVKKIDGRAFQACDSLKNVYYSGSSTQWKSISIDKWCNGDLLNAKIHYNYVAAPVIKITTSAGKPKISWSAVDGATKYYIYRSTDGKTYKQYTTTTKTSYTNTNAKIGTTYYYKVKAAKVVNDKTVKSAYSNVKSIKCVPAAPVVSISRSNGKPKLTWKAVTGASKYYIYRSTDGKTYKQYTYTTKTSYTNTGAASGKKYYYKVKAVAVVNKTNVFSAYSTAKNLMTTITTPTVSITTANGKPKITWKAVTGADKYIVYRSTDGKTFKQLSTTTKTSLTNTGAKKNTKYYYKVKAVCTKNTSANSALSKAVSIKATK